MNDDQRPVFLERHTYRRRRMKDAATLLPLLGAALISIPLLWLGEARTANVMLYLFGVWVLLAVLSALISRHLHTDDASDAEKDPQDVSDP